MFVSPLHTEMSPHGRIAGSTFTPANPTVSNPELVTFAFMATYSDRSAKDVSTAPYTTYILTHGVFFVIGNTYTSP